MTISELAKIALDEGRVVNVTLPGKPWLAECRHELGKTGTVTITKDGEVIREYKVGEKE